MMKNHKTTALLLIAAFALALMPGSTGAQRLYDKERDQQAQAALPLSQALKTGELFGRQLRNLASLTKKDFETEFALTGENIDAFSLTLMTWGLAHKQVCDIEKINVEGKLPSKDEVTNELKNVKKSITDAQDSLKAFKAAIKLKEDENGDEDDKEKSLLATVFGALGDLEELTSFAEEVGTSESKLINTRTLKTLQEVQKITGELKKVYDEYKTKVDGFNELNGQLSELRLVLKKVAIQSLQVDEEHWKNLAAITNRRESERAEVLGLISEYKGIIGRLGLVDFDEKNKDPEKIVGFCTAVDKAVLEPKEPDARPFKLITDHISELTERGQLMETDNRDVEFEATMALKAIKGASSESERREAASRTVTSLETAIKNLDKDSPNQIEKAVRLAMAKAKADLEGAVKTSTEKSVKALNAVIIAVRTTRKQIRNMIGDIPQVLFIYAALIARGPTPSRLADLRFAQELHAYSIRKSAVRARAYELTVSTGAQRLALFHKGGIKPSDIAELVFAASNVAITPAILAR